MMFCTNVNILSFPGSPSLYITGVDMDKRSLCEIWKGTVKLQIWGSEAWCGRHKVSLEFKNTVANLLPHLTGKGQQLGLRPLTPAPTGSPSASVSLSHCFFCKRPALSRLEKMKDRVWLHGSSMSFHVLVCLHSPLLWVQAFFPRADWQWLQVTVR